MIIIDSLQNPKIKKTVKLLQRSSARKEQGLFVIDGLREIKEAMGARINIETLFYCPELALEQPLILDKKKVIQVNKGVFNKISYKEKPDGFVAVAKTRAYSLERIKLGLKPLVVILENIEKPGNLGAIIRTAYAAGVDAIIINNNQTDIYNPNVVRASEGKIFSIPIILLSQKETIDWCKQHNIQIFATATKAKDLYSKHNFKQPLAFVLGSESEGLSKEWLAKADQLIKIPMKKGIDSLNVSVSAAIIIFETIRQRSID